MRPSTSFAMPIALAALLSTAGPTCAQSIEIAAIDRYVPGVETLNSKIADTVVERVQRGLASIGLYTGPVNGRMNEQTEQAIAIYQRRNGMPEDGLASEKLAIHLETGFNVKALLNRLEQSREQNIKRARQALRENPATRHLVEEGRPTDIADAARNAAPCFRNPTARCLLDEAAESAKAIPKDNMRDWALGELLAAQARAGMVEGAMDTVGRIEDPRLIMVALREIAEAQASAGRADDALAATAIIPDAEKRIEALAAIAAIHARRHDSQATTRAIAELLEALGPNAAPVQRVAYLARLAIILAETGEAAAADRMLNEATLLARRIPTPTERTAALRHIVSAEAEMGHPAQALAILEEIEPNGDRTPVLIAAAKAQARDGDPQRALETAEGISASRYLAVVLCAIASVHAGSGAGAAARDLVRRAEALTQSIEFPYARAFALSRIALVLTEIGRLGGAADFQEAATTAQSISDVQLRAQVLWSLAAERRRAGDATGATETEALAEAASEEIKSALSRVWLFSDVARNHLDIGEHDSAWSAFRRALYTSEGIDNAWARARALSKVAGILIQLTDDAATRP